MAAAKAAQAEGKPSFGSRLKNYFKGVIRELKKVHWPDKKQVAIYTGVVIGTVLACAIVISLLDTVLSFLFGLILK